MATACWVLWFIEKARWKQVYCCSLNLASRRPVTCATKNKVKMLLSLALSELNAECYSLSCFFPLNCCLCRTARCTTPFAFQMNSVYSAMWWSLDSAKCLGPCLIVNPWVAPLVASVCFRGIWLKTWQKKWSKNFDHLNQICRENAKNTMVS